MTYVLLFDQYSILMGFKFIYCNFKTRAIFFLIPSKDHLHVIGSLCLLLYSISVHTCLENEMVEMFKLFMSIKSLYVWQR